MRRYLDILNKPGALAFCLSGFWARAGAAMSSIGIVLMVSAIYGSYGLAGAISAVNASVWAVGAAVLSNLVDKYGQRRIMLPMALVSVAFYILLIVLAVMEVSPGILFIPAAISGFGQGSIGAMVRSRWNHLLSDARQIHTAFSLESVLDEVSYIAGPLLATALATNIWSAAGLSVAVLIFAPGAMLFYSLRTTEPPLHPAKDSSERARFMLAIHGVLPVLLVSLMLGIIFGAVDVTVVAACEQWGDKGAAGYVLAAFSCGSAVAGFYYGSRHWHWPLPRRFLVTVSVMTLGMVTYFFTWSPGVLAVAGFISSLAVAPALINANALIQQIVPTSRLTEGIAWVGTSLGMGVSVGSSAAGALIDHGGSHLGFSVSFAAAALAAVLVMVTQRVISRAAS